VRRPRDPCGRTMTAPACWPRRAWDRTAASWRSWMSPVPMSPPNLLRLVAPIAGTHDFVIAFRARGEREPGSMAGRKLAAGPIIGAIAGWTSGQYYTDICVFRAIPSDALASQTGVRLEPGNADESGVWLLSRAEHLPTPDRGAVNVVGSLMDTLSAASRILLTLATITFRRQSVHFRSL
jgi:hypothetical protein